MSWQDRVSENIVLIAPVSGATFYPLWRGGDRKLDKKVAVFDYPDMDGSVVQDLGSKGITYPLEFYFEGPDHDLQADRFFNACRESGIWIVDHPVRGRLFLQLTSVSEAIQPVSSGNITQINAEWLEPFKTDVKITLPQLKNEIIELCALVNREAAKQFKKQVNQDDPSGKAGLTVSTKSMLQKIKDSLKNIYSKVASINAYIMSTRNAVLSEITSVLSDVAAIAGEIQTLIQLPVLIVDDVTGRFNYYDDLFNGIIKGIEEDIEKLDLMLSNIFGVRNKAAVNELAANAALVAVANIAVTGSFKSRSQALSAAEQLTGFMDSMTTAFDGVQKKFSSANIEYQYFNNTTSYQYLLRLMAMARKYLYMAATDLSIEKRIILDRPRTPIEMTITEYGSLGADDKNLDLFITTNNLKGNDILLLQAGREVVIYV